MSTVSFNSILGYKFADDNKHITRHSKLNFKHGTKCRQYRGIHALGYNNNNHNNNYTMYIIL